MITKKPKTATIVIILEIIECILSIIYLTMQILR